VIKVKLVTIDMFRNVARHGLGGLEPPNEKFAPQIKFSDPDNRQGRQKCRDTYDYFIARVMQYA